MAKVVGLDIMSMCGFSGTVSCASAHIDDGGVEAWLQLLIQSLLCCEPVAWSLDSLFPSFACLQVDAGRVEELASEPFSYPEDPDAEE